MPAINSSPTLRFWHPNAGIWKDIHVKLRDATCQVDQFDPVSPGSPGRLSGIGTFGYHYYRYL